MALWTNNLRVNDPLTDGPMTLWTNDPSLIYLVFWTRGTGLGHLQHLKSGLRWFAMVGAIWSWLGVIGDGWRGFGVVGRGLRWLGVVEGSRRWLWVVGDCWRWLGMVGGEGGVLRWFEMNGVLRWFEVVGGGWRLLLVIGGCWRWLGVVGGGWVVYIYAFQNKFTKMYMIDWLIWIYSNTTS